MIWRALIPWAFRIVVVAVALWLGRRWYLRYEQASAVLNSDEVINNILKLFGLGIALLAIFFYDILRGVSGRIAGLLFPEVDNVQVRPQYSTAEARVHEGRYAEAIEEFHKVWDHFPADVNAHVRIAELLCQHFGRYDEAVSELQAALGKKNKPETWAFLANRLVDIQVEYQHDFVGARETLQRILLKLPGTKYAEAAVARVAALNEKEAQERQPPKGPLKVAEDTDRV